MRFICLFVIICIGNILFAQEIKKVELPKPSGYSKNLQLSEIASKIEYIPLETNAESVLSDNASCTSISKDFLFISQGGDLLQFTQSGKFIRQINTQGKGPKECFVRYHAIDENKQLIYLYNHYVHNILVFGFDGKYLKTIRDPFDNIIGCRVEQLTCDSKTGNILLTFDNSHGNMPYKFAVMDPDGRIIHQEPNYDRYKIGKRPLDVAILPLPIYSHKNTLYYHYAYSDTVFTINNNYKCTPAYVINLPDKLTLEEALKTSAYVIRYSEIGKRNNINGMCESTSFLFITYSSDIFDHERTKNYISLFDKQKDQLIGNIDPEITNDLDGGLNVQYFYNNGEFMWNLLQPIDLKEHLTNAHFAKSKALYPDQQKKLKTMVDQLDEEDNPILMIVTLK